MKNGFMFKGIHSSEIGVILKTKSRRLLPGVKNYMYDIPNADGSYDFTDANNFKRPFYSDRIFELDLQITGDNLAELQRSAARIALWLTGSGDLVFDDTAAVKWHGRVASDVAFTPERRGKTAVLSVIFQTSPIGSAEFDTIDGIYLGNSIYLNSDLPVDMDVYFEKKLEAGANSVDFINIGDFYIRPVLEFIGNAENITVAFGDSKIMLEDISSDVYADFEKCIVTDGCGANILSKMQGEFFELPPGISKIDIYTGAPCILRVRYVPKTIYDFEFSDICGGE